MLSLNQLNTKLTLYTGILHFHYVLEENVCGNYKQMTIAYNSFKFKDPIPKVKAGILVNCKDGIYSFFKSTKF